MTGVHDRDFQKEYMLYIKYYTTNSWVVPSLFHNALRTLIPKLGFIYTLSHRCPLKVALSTYKMVSSDSICECVVLALKALLWKEESEAYETGNDNSCSELFNHNSFYGHKNCS